MFRNEFSRFKSRLVMFKLLSIPFAFMYNDTVLSSISTAGRKNFKSAKLIYQYLE